MDNANSAPIVIAGPALGTLAFEWLYFPTLALTALGTMSWFLHTGQHVETASFVISVSVLLITMLFERVHPLNPQWNQSRGDPSRDSNGNLRSSWRTWCESPATGAMV